MATRKTAPRRKAKQDAIALLKADHKTVKELLASLEKTTSRAPGRRKELLGKIAQEVRVHARVEELVFYPAYHDVAKRHEDEKLFFEAHEEHALVDHLLPQLEDEDPVTEVFAGKAKVLKDLIEHHAEEEESEMFPRARKLLGAARLAELGDEIEQRKGELQAEMGDDAATRQRRKASAPSQSGRSSIRNAGTAKSAEIVE